MSTQISPQAEAMLIDEAQRQGISVDVLIERLVSESHEAIDARCSASELPAWDLGVIEPLHRRDLYDDVS